MNAVEFHNPFIVKMSLKKNELFFNHISICLHIILGCYNWLLNLLFMSYVDEEMDERS